MKFAAVEDQEAGFRPDINDLPDIFYVQDEFIIRANDEERPILEEIPQPRVTVIAEPLP